MIWLAKSSPEQGQYNVTGPVWIRAMTAASVVALLHFPASAQEVYRWVDANGSTHYGEVVPEGITDFERVVLPPSPARPPDPAPPTASERTLSPPESRPRASATTGTEPTIRAETAPPRAAPQVEASDMTLEQLDQLCEDAREEAIAPLRAAAIAECKETGQRNDPGYCERFYATYGDAVRLQTGVMRPRLFNDLPACVVAFEERRRRAR